MSTFDFASHLLSGEKVLWSGQPVRGFLLTGRDGLLIPFSLMFCSFAVFWESQVLAQAQAPYIMKLWGVPFILIGLYIVAGRFVVDAWVRRGTHYAVTNKRILILRSSPSRKLTTMALDRLPDTTLNEGAHGRGTICFGQEPTMWSRGANGFSGWTPSLHSTPQFLAIENARGVFETIQAVHNGS